MAQGQLKARIEQRIKELERKSKDELWRLMEQHKRVMCRDAHYLKAWLVGDVLRHEFGNRTMDAYWKGGN